MLGGSLRREHVDLIGENSVAFSETLRHVGRCRYLPCFTPAMPAEIFELPRIICILRMELSNWKFILWCLRRCRVYFGGMRRGMLAGLVAARRAPSW